MAGGKRLAVRYRTRISKKSRRRKIGALDEGWDVESDAADRLAMMRSVRAATSGKRANAEPRTMAKAATAEAVCAWVGCWMDGLGAVKVDALARQLANGFGHVICHGWT